MIEMTPLTDREYKLISGLVYDKFGIKLGEQKRSLIVGRLQKILRQNGFSSFKEYYDYVNDDTTGQALVTLIDRISTNHTYFYRENDHFHFFYNKVLPKLTSLLSAQGTKQFRLWCAGCSSGEESSLLAILLLDFFGKDISSWDVGILGTDISVTALEKASKGKYTDDNVSKLPNAQKTKYFDKLPDGLWKVKDKVKDLILYKRLNLMQEKFPFKRKFHTIFCRNVMIYFDNPTRENLIRKYYDNSLPGGFLFIGHSESLRRDNGYYNYIQPSVYVRA